MERMAGGEPHRSAAKAVATIKLACSPWSETHTLCLDRLKRTHARDDLRDNRDQLGAFRQRIVPGKSRDLTGPARWRPATGQFRHSVRPHANSRPVTQHESR